MISAFGFAKFLLENSGTQKSSTEISLYNAFRGLESKDELLSSKDIVKVFKSLLLFPHWRSKKAELSLCFERNFKAYIDSTGINTFEYPKLDEVQIVKVDSANNLKKLLVRYFEGQYPDSKVRCTKNTSGGFLVICLSESGSLAIHHCNEELCLIEGEFSPLMEDYALHYTQDLKIDESQNSQVLLKPFRKIRLQKFENWRVYETQGYSVKNLIPKEINSIEELPELFYHIKAIESRFIHKSSDPLYLTVTRDLELCIEKLAENSEIYKEEALKTYQKARNAFENIFPDDRLLHLLLKELAMVIASDRAKTWDEPDRENKEEWLKIQNEKPLDSTNLLPIVE